MPWTGVRMAKRSAAAEKTRLYGFGEINVDTKQWKDCDTHVMEMQTPYLALKLQRPLLQRPGSREVRHSLLNSIKYPRRHSHYPDHLALNFHRST